MRALALFAWLLALCLAVLIVRNQDTAVPAARVVQSASLALWQGEPQLIPAAPPAPIALPPVRPAPVLPPLPSSAVAGCARLGIFPGQAWAESVAPMAFDRDRAADAAVDAFGRRAGPLLVLLMSASS